MAKRKGGQAKEFEEGPERRGLDFVSDDAVKIRIFG